MKIGLVSAYDYAHPGGVTEHVRYLAAGLRRRGHDVTVFAPCSDKELAEQATDFIRVGRPLPLPPPHWLLLRQAAAKALCAAAPRADRRLQSGPRVRAPLFSGQLSRHPKRHRCQALPEPGPLP